jgi:hypothetical protein
MQLIAHSCKQSREAFIYRFSYELKTMSYELR